MGQHPVHASFDKRAGFQPELFADGALKIGCAGLRGRSAGRRASGMRRLHEMREDRPGFGKVIVKGSLIRPAQGLCPRLHCRDQRKPSLKARLAFSSARSSDSARRSSIRPASMDCTAAPGIYLAGSGSPSNLAFSAARRSFGDVSGGRPISAAWAAAGSARLAGSAVSGAFGFIGSS